MKKERLCPFHAVIENGSKRYGILCSTGAFVPDVAEIGKQFCDGCNKCGWYPPVEKRRKAELKKHYGGGI